MICDKHGRTGFYEACEHVDAEFSQGRYRPFHRLEFWLGMLVCDGCWDRYSLARFESHPDIAGKPFYEADEDSQAVKEYERIYDSWERRCWCDKCVAELRANASDASGDAAQPADLTPPLIDTTSICDLTSSTTLTARGRNEAALEDS